jgi:hypothetical protein
MVQPSTLPAEALHKGFIRAYYVGTHTADVQLAASTLETLPAVRVATHIQAADCVVDRECTVLFFDASNPADAIVIAIQGALPSGGGGGVSDHGLLTGLGDDDHLQYALLAGRGGGQTLIGGTASGGNLLLQSTAHATRGRVYALDDLQLLSDILRGSDGTNRLQFAPASPHLTLTGQTKITGETAVGGGAPETNKGLIIAPSPLPSTSSWTGIYGAPQVSIPSGSPSGSLYGLSFVLAMTGGGGGAIVDYARALNVGINTMSLTATITQAVLAYLCSPLLYFGTPSIPTWKALYAGPVASNKIIDAYGAHIENITANTGFTRLLEIGPATPFLRLVGGADPAANVTNLYLKEGANLRRVQVYDDGVRKYMILA